MIKQTSTATFPLASVLTVVFVVLKLTHVIAWSWLWVLAPLWITFGFVGTVLGLALLAALIAAFLKK